MFLLGQLGQPCGQDLHRHFLVLVLAAFILAGDNDIGRQMRDTNRRVRLVDMLTARAAAAVGVDPQIFRVDLHGNIFVQLRCDFHHRERSLALARRVERRNAHQPMYAFFVFEIAVGVLALDQKRRALDAGLGIVLQIKHLHAVALLLAPARVHSEQHGRPVHRVDAAGTRMDRKDRAAVIILTGQ